MAQRKSNKMKRRSRVLHRTAKPQTGTPRKTSGTVCGVQVSKKSTKVRRRWVMSGTTTMMTTITVGT